MLTEIEIEDVGTYRLPNMWQWKRIQRVRGLNRHIAPLAVGLGLTYKEFRFAIGEAEGRSAGLLGPHITGQY
ncbi:hypothetical protein QFZ34_003230 [Phyllobacterium ifriqiyense]|uniref:Uncharacterized protein n=1 Tax=Phyllobacterium ifriqiyense TaxID=314238 RepID=A0ABU0SE99_9HYPH|nr:hypothetical protein [Phyllobacterium ifriqiyense]MDQ0998048.1 hypothetical protein [Phyllobacterium ifriqiyense]